VWKGVVDVVPLGVTVPLFVTIPRGRYGELDAQVKLLPELTAPLASDQVVGKITVTLDDKVVASRDLVALNAVEEAGFFGRTWDGLRLWTGGLFGDDDEDPKADAEAADNASDSEAGAADSASPEPAAGKPAGDGSETGQTADDAASQ
jgi:hypothetical protein